MALAAPVLPFRATGKGALDLVPEARLLPGDGTSSSPGTYGVTEAQVEAWVEELTGVVAMTLDGWERLSTDVDAGEPDGTLSDYDEFTRAARTVIHNGAASYLEAARHPERAAVNDTSYAAVLWQRYEAGLDRLAGWLTRRLDSPDAGDLVDAVGPGDAAYAFPPVLFGDGLRF